MAAPRSSTLLAIVGAVAAFAVAGYFFQRASSGAHRGFAPSPAIAARLQTAAEPRWNEALARPEVNAALEGLFAAVGSDPEVGATGTALVDALSGDPTIAGQLQSLVAELAGNPAMAQMGAELMAEHPNASPDEIGQLAGARIGGAASSPAFSAAWDRAWNELMATPELAGSMRQVGEAVSSSQTLQAALDGAVSALDEEAVGERILALNGGEPPDEARTVQILLDHAFTVDRLAQAYTALFSLPALRTSVAALLRDLGRAPAAKRLVIATAGPVLGDPAFRAAFAGVVGAMAAKAPSEDSLHDAFAKLLGVPSVRHALAGLVGQLLTDPDLTRIMHDDLSGIAKDPAFQAVIVKLMKDW